MKKYVEIPMESLERLNGGKFVEGSLRIDECTGKLTFRAYQRKTRMRAKDKTVLTLEHGWVKESAQRIKFFSSVKKELGIAKVTKAMEREMKEAVRELKTEITVIGYRKDLRPQTLDNKK